MLIHRHITDWTPVRSARESRTVSAALWAKLARHGYPQTALQPVGPLQKRSQGNQALYRLTLNAVSTAGDYTVLATHRDKQWQVSLFQGEQQVC